MAVWERQTQRIPPSFSSSLLESIYHSIDESTSKNELPRVQDRTRKHAPRVEEDAESLRRAIMIASRGGHFPSNSGSSPDSSTSSSTETDSSASKSTPRSLRRKARTPDQAPPPPPPPVKVPRVPEAKPKRDGKSTSAKSRAQKIYEDLKKAREPNSPGGRIASFLNSIFNPRSLKSSSRPPGEWSSSSATKSGSLYDTRTTGHVTKSRSVNDAKAKAFVMKSRSTNDAKTTTGPVMKSRSVNDTKTHARSCLSRSQFSRGNNNISSKSKGSVRFADEGSAPSVPTVGSRYIKKNIDSIRLQEPRKHELRDCYYYNSKKKNHECDFDEMSCASSDLFELETNVVEELPVYGSTSYRIIAGELVM